MPDTPTPLMEMIDSYLDGVLSPEDRVRFEAAMQEHPPLREAIEVQRALDASIRRVYAPCEMNATQIGRARGSARPAWLKYAAIVAIAGLGAMSYWINKAPAPTVVSPFEQYNTIVQKGFRPYEVCTGPDEFLNYMKDHYNAPVTIQTRPNIELVGWGMYDSVMSDSTHSLLARVDGEPVVVFLDKAKWDRTVKETDPTLKLHKRRIGGVVWFEVSSRGEPVILPLLIEK